jgi:hypothetical protein
MRIKRLLVGSVTAALLGALPVALTTSSAEAAPTHRSFIQVEPQAKGSYLYRQSIVIKGRVLIEGLGECSNGSTYCRPPDTAGGQVVLYRQLSGTTPWKVVATQANEAADFMFTTTAWQNATYLIRYTGGSIGSGDSTHTFTRKDFARYIKVGRHPHGKVVKSGGRLYFRGNVDPGYHYRYVTIQKKACSSCSWRTYKKVKTTGTGAYSGRVYAPSTGRWYWRSLVPGVSPTWANGYSATWYTYKSLARAA